MSRCDCLSKSAESTREKRGVSFAALGNLAARLGFRPAHRAAKTTVLNVRLSAGEAQSFAASANNSFVCQSGIVWLSESGDARDIVLRVGEEFRCAPSAHIVVSALTSAARIRVET